MKKTCPYCGTVFETNRSRKIYCQGYCAYHARRFWGQYRLHGEIHQLISPETVDWDIVKKRKEDYLKKKMQVEKALHFYDLYGQKNTLQKSDDEV